MSVNRSKLRGLLATPASGSEDRIVQNVFDAAIVLPHPEHLEDPEVVPSERVQKRQIEVAELRGQRRKLRIWEPASQPATVFQSLGFTMEMHQPRRHLIGSKASVVESLPNLGGYLVYAPRGELPLETLRHELGDDFVVTKDYRVFQKGEERDGDGPSATDTHEWPSISGIDEARRLEVDGKGVRIGVVDTGLDADHLEFTRRRIPFTHVPYREEVAPTRGRRGFDPTGHGSHIASIIAGSKVGVAPAARLHVAGIADNYSLTSHLRRIVRGIDWLYETFVSDEQNRGKPIILNFSLGVEPIAPEGEDSSDFAQALLAIQGGLEALIDQNMLVIAAIGNDGEGRYRLPAGLPEVLAVGAVDREGEDVMYFSGNVKESELDTGHTGPDLVGFGHNVLGADGRDMHGASLYARWSGTSQASAYVSGVAALYWSMSRNRGCTALEIRNLLVGNARPPASGYDSARWGAGLARFVP